MKPLISKLKKSYELYITPKLTFRGNELLVDDQEKEFFSTLYIYPTQSLEKNTFVEIPLETFNYSRKNLSLKYRVIKLDHENKTLIAQLDQFQIVPMFTTEGSMYSSNFSANISFLVKNPKLLIEGKILINRKGGEEKSLSQPIKKNIRNLVLESLSKEQNITQLLLKVIDKSFNKELLVQVPEEYKKFIKTIIITRTKRLTF